MTIRKILTRAIKEAGGDGLCNPRLMSGAGLACVLSYAIYEVAQYFNKKRKRND